jgi:hypothetical protein
MNVINNVIGEKAEELAGTIAHMIMSKPTLGVNIHPFLISERYVKDDASGLFVPHYMYGALSNPSVIFNLTKEDEDTIYLFTHCQDYSTKIGNQKWIRQTGHMPIPVFLKAVDAETAEKNINIENETIINLYLGRLAYDQLRILNESKPNNK